MIHERAWERLPDLLSSRGDSALRAHVAACHACQRQLFLLGRVDRLLRQGRRNADHPLRGIFVSRRWIAPLPALGAAAALALVLFLPRSPSAHGFVLRTVDGRAVARATIARADQSNVEISLAAHGLPRARGDELVLWTRPGDGADAIPVGRFMVDHSGSCRARFNLPTSGRWTRFWVTPSSDPSVVIATT